MTLHKIAPEPKPEPLKPVQITIDDPRVFLAAERTLLAWIRTSIAMMGLGFLVAKFGLFVREMLVVRGQEASEAPRFSLWIGAVMVTLGILMVLSASYEHLRFLKRLDMADFVGSFRGVMSITIAVILAIVGVAMVLYLFAV